MRSFSLPIRLLWLVCISVVVVESAHSQPAAQPKAHPTTTASPEVVIPLVSQQSPTVLRVGTSPNSPVDNPAANSGSPQPSYKRVVDSLEAYDNKRVPKVKVLQVRNPSSEDGTRFNLNDYVVLDVQDLRLALRRAKRSFKDLRLYVDDIGLPMPPIAVDTIHQRDVATVRFRLVRDESTEPTWQLFYKVPGKYEHPGTFNIGFDTGQLGSAFPSSSEKLSLELVQKGWLLVGVGLLGVLVWAFLWLVSRSSFIRSDRSAGIPTDEKTGKPAVISALYEQMPYSLPKSQIAFWTLLVIAGYLMISLVTSALPIIPNGLLGLLGISLATGLFNQFINRSQADAATAAGGVPVNIGKSAGWLRDVLTDATGVSAVRLQFLVFNAIAGLYFIRYVLLHWSLPDFDSSLLALISISSVGQLVNKTTSNPSPPASPVAMQDRATGASFPPNSGGGNVATPPASTSAATASASSPDPAVGVGVASPLLNPLSSAPALPPNTSVNVLPDGTPTSRADEDDNAAPAVTTDPVAVPQGNLRLG